jgi:hypothetical protein
MVIRRYVVAPGGRESVAAEAQPELLIAFAPATVRERGEADRIIAAGSVLRMKAGESFELMSSGAGAAHVLAIRLKIVRL